MDCARTRFFLNAYLDGELTDAEARSVGIHLSGCRRCAARLESFRRIRTIVKSCSPRANAPVDLRRRIAQHRSRRRHWSRVWRPAAVAGVISLLVIPVVADSLTRPSVPGSVLSESPVERVVQGKFFCLRCALADKLGLPAPHSKAPHIAAFRAEDGEIWILLNREACPQPIPKTEVAVTGRFFPQSHLMAAESVGIPRR